MTYATVRLSRGLRSPARSLRLLVDTGAFYSVIPARTLRSLGVRPRWQERFQLADGRIIERSVGKAHVQFLGEPVETFVVFGEPGDDALLGSYALEGLRLEVDPRSKRLRPMGVIPMIRFGRIAS